MELLTRLAKVTILIATFGICIAVAQEENIKPVPAQSKVEETTSKASLDLSLELKNKSAKDKKIINDVHNIEKEKSLLVEETQIDISPSKVINNSEDSNKLERLIDNQDKPITHISKEKSNEIKNKNNISAESVISKQLDDGLVELVKSLSNMVESKKTPGFSWTSVGDFVLKFLGIMASIFGPYVAYLGLTQVPFFEKHKSTIASIATISGIVLCIYIFSSIVTSLLYALVAFIILITALVVACAFIIKFIDDSYPEVKESIIAAFSPSNHQTNLKSLSRKNCQAIGAWLDSFVSSQQLTGQFKLKLNGSIVKGFDNSNFELVPHQNISPHWAVIDKEVLVPINIKLTVSDSKSGEEAVVININNGLVAVQSGEKLIYKQFNFDGVSEMVKSMLHIEQEKIKKILEEQATLNSDLQVAKAGSNF